MYANEESVRSIQIERKSPFRFASFPPMVRLHYAKKYEVSPCFLGAGGELRGRHSIIFEDSNIIFTFSCSCGTILKTGCVRLASLSRPHCKLYSRSAKSQHLSPLKWFLQSYRKVSFSGGDTVARARFCHSTC